MHSHHRQTIHAWPTKIEADSSSDELHSFLVSLQQLSTIYLLSLLTRSCMTIHRHHEPMIGFVLLSLSSVTVACNLVCAIILSCARKQTASNPKFLDQRKLQFLFCAHNQPRQPRLLCTSNSFITAIFSLGLCTQSSPSSNPVSISAQRIPSSKQTTAN